MLLMPTAISWDYECARGFDCGRRKRFGLAEVAPNANLLCAESWTMESTESRASAIRLQRRQKIVNIKEIRMSPKIDEQF